MSYVDIRIETEIGTLTVYASEDDQCAGITLMPKGCDEEIDIAYARCIDKNGNDASNPNHGEMKKVETLCYEDVWTEDHTRKFIIDIDEAVKSLTMPYQPDSQKL